MLISWDSILYIYLWKKNLVGYTNTQMVSANGVQEE